MKRNLVPLIGLAGLAVVALDQRAVSSSQSLGAITLTEVAPRILTPNNDQFNDVAYFQFDPGLSGLPIQTGVFDINGAKIAELRLTATEQALTWDGKDDSGNLMPAGIYVYSIEIGKNRATGTIVVAR